MFFQGEWILFINGATKSLSFNKTVFELELWKELVAKEVRIFGSSHKKINKQKFIEDAKILEKKNWNMIGIWWKIFQWDLLRARWENIFWHFFLLESSEQKSIMRYFWGHYTNDNGRIDGLEVAEVLQDSWDTPRLLLHCHSFDFEITNPRSITQCR